MKQVTAAVIIKNGKVLLTRRKQGEKLAGFWEFPGGKLEEGETLRSCLERELLEELGIHAKAGPLLAESEYHYDHGAIRLLAFFTEIQGAENLMLTVHDRAEWVDPDELTNYKLSPADIPIALKICNMLSE